MNISLIICVLLLSIVILAGCYQRSWVLPFWLISLLVFPTARVKVGGAPVYLYDLMTVLVIVFFAITANSGSWPRHLPRWHWRFIGLSLVLSVAFGFVRYGFLPELVW